jgi:hypothetical protein
MSASRQWSQGLQWGACAWLAYVAGRAAIRAVHAPIGAHVVLAVAGYAFAAEYGGPPSVAFALMFFVPMSLPLLPLVVLPVPPRIFLALIGLGGWREARSRLGGVGPLLVAVALVTLNRGAFDLCVHLQHGQGWMARAWWLPAGVFVAAAGVISATSRQGRAAITT